MEIACKYASRPSKNPVVPKIAANASRSSVDAVRPPPDVLPAKKRTAHIVCKKPATPRQGDASVRHVNHARRRKIVNNRGISRKKLNPVSFAKLARIDSFERSQRQHRRL